MNLYFIAINGSMYVTTVFDHVYTPANIEHNRELLEGYSFGSHKHFPGPVEEQGGSGLGRHSPDGLRRSAPRSPPAGSRSAWSTWCSAA